MMHALKALLERVEKAEGPDREIDAELHVALVKPEQRADDLRYFRVPSANMDHMEMCAPGTYWLKERSGASLQTAPKYTTSIDAALSLVERVLPGWTRAVDATVPRAGIDVELFPPHIDDPCHRRVVKGTHARETHATLIALLKAKIAEDSAATMNRESSSHERKCGARYSHAG